MRHKVLPYFSLLILSSCLTFSCGGNGGDPIKPVDPEEETEEQRKQRITNNLKNYKLDIDSYIDEFKTLDATFQKAYTLLSEFEYKLIEIDDKSSAIDTVKCFRSETYSGTKWNFIAGAPTSISKNQFETFKTNKKQEGIWFNSGNDYKDKFNNNIDFYHMIAVLNTYMYTSSQNARDLSSWGGDNSQLVKEIKPLTVDKLEYAKTGGGTFSNADLLADIDGANIYYIYSNENYYKHSKGLAIAFAYYYSNLKTESDRYTFYIDKVFDNKLDVNTLYNRLSGNTYLKEWNKQNGISFVDDKQDFEIGIEAFISRISK